MKRQASKAFVTLGLRHGGDRRPPRHRRIEPRGEVSERIIAQALGNLQGAAGAATPQRFNTGKGRPAEQPAHHQTPPQGGGNAPLGAASAGKAQGGLQAQTLRPILFQARRRRASPKRFCLRHRAKRRALAAKTSATACFNS
jgi:hypothetical protein